MNIVKKLIRKEEYELSYVAFDGETFDCSQSCITHEAFYHKQALHLEPFLRKKVKTFDEEHDATAYYIDSLQDFLDMKRYVLSDNSSYMFYGDLAQWQYEEPDWYFYYCESSGDNRYDDYVFTRFKLENDVFSKRLHQFVEQFDFFSK